jgi:hypothetical protein
LTGREDWDWEKFFLRYFTEHGHLMEKVVNRDDTDKVVNQQPGSRFPQLAPGAKHNKGSSCEKSPE